MTQDEIVALVGRLDPGAKVRFAEDGHARVLASALMARPALDELLAAVPDAQVAFGFESPLWDDMLDGARTCTPVGERYELDDIAEDGTWKLGRRPAGWRTTP